MVLIGVDLGTTHCKAGLFTDDGLLLRHASLPTITSQTADGHPFYDPDELCRTATSVIAAVISTHDAVDDIHVVGVTSMAEAGLLVGRSTGEARTHVIPWYDVRTTTQAEALSRTSDRLDLFRRTGLHPSFKQGLPKILWLRDQDSGIIDGAVWLSVADYIVYRLTGRMATDPTLAARTYAFNIGEGSWDEEWIRRLRLEPSLFPPILPTGESAGSVTDTMAATLGLRADTSVAVCGHDHICTLLAAGIVEPGTVLDSIGTAESMLGVIRHREIDGREFESGLAIVPHVLPGLFCWLGGLSAAGGSIEWLRLQMDGDAADALPYERVMELARGAGEGPTGILYFPYLSGSGAPCPDASVRAAFIGLSASHGRSHLVKAVLEGTAYEAESIRRAAEKLTGEVIGDFIAVGGGAKNHVWLQIKSDVSGCRFQVPHLPEATVLGAALAAGLGAGVIGGVDDVTRIARGFQEEPSIVSPDPDRHTAYCELYEREYLSFQGPLRRRGMSHE